MSESIKSALRAFISFFLLSISLTACTAIDTIISGASSIITSASPAESASASACALTEPVWVKSPEDSAIQGPAGYGYYFVNEDLSIWASAGWAVDQENPLRVSAEGVKVGWFRPAGATLEITGQRIDAQAPPLEAHASCCYPTRFQASGLYFPTQGCWEVTARAADSELTFIVWVESE